MEEKLVLLYVSDSKLIQFMIMPDPSHKIPESKFKDSQQLY